MVGLVAVVGGAGLFLLRAPAKSLACPPQGVALTVVSSPDKYQVLRQAAQDFQRTNPKVGQRCVAIQVVEKSSGDAEARLAAGWNVQVDGPRPDVWAPDSSLWSALLSQRLRAERQPDVIPAERPSIAASPLVMAMPRPMAQALGWPRKAIGMADLLGVLKQGDNWRALGHPEWGTFLVGKTNPNESTPGLEGVLGTFYVAVQQARLGLPTPQALANHTVQALALGVQRSPGPFADVPETFLANLQQADDDGNGLSYVSMIPLDEKSVLDYNRGNVTGDPAAAGKHPKPKVPLVGIYPKEGTFAADHPYLALNAQWVDGAKRRAAASFLRYLQSGPVQSGFQAAGFRSYSGVAGPLVTAANGLVPQPSGSILPMPPTTVTDAALQAWNNARKRGNVLAVIDVSGSMSALVPGTGKSKLDLVKSAAIRALSLFDDQDYVGVWAFSTNLDGAKPYKQLVPLGPMGQDLGGGQTRRNAIATSFDQLRPGGNTGLYDSTLAAYQFLQAHYSAGRINTVVVMTDGKDETRGGVSLPILLEQLQVGQATQPVRIVTIGYGADADAGALRQVAQVTDGAFYSSRNPNDIAGIFLQAISNF